MSFWTGTHWEPVAPPPAPARSSPRRHALEAFTEGALLSLVIVALVAGTAFARGSGTITVPDGVYGDTVTATVNPGGTGSWARASCRQAGVLVYVEYVHVTADNHAMFTLGPTPSWEGGDASCTAEELKLRSNGSWRVLASAAFHVDG